MRSLANFLSVLGMPFALVTAYSIQACMTPPPPGAESAPSAAALGASSPSALRNVPYRWKSVEIRGGGFVTGLVYSPLSQGILYARTDIGGAYRYDPQNQSWIPLTDFVSKADSNYMGIESIAVDPKRADRVYLAVGMYTQSWAGHGAFLRSDDRGEHFKVVPMPQLKMGGNENGRSDGERLAVDPHQPKILFFGSRRAGLWKSTDEAESWSRVESFPLAGDEQGFGLPFVIFDPASGKDGEATPLIYVGSSQKDVGLYRSRDGGKTWQAVPKQPTGFMPSRAALDKDGTLYVSYQLGVSPYAVQNGAVYRYDPRSETWTDITPLKPSDQDRFGYGGVALDPRHPGTLLAATMDRWSKGAELFRSLDGGKTWKALMATAQLDAGGAPHAYHHRNKLDPPQWVGDVKIDPFDPKRAMLIEGGGIWATEDLTAADVGQPTHWSFHTKNLEETAVSDLISPPEGAPLLSVMGDLCGFRHDKLDESPARGNFENPTCASASDIDFAGKKPSVLVRAGSYPWDDSKSPRGAVSTDGGVTWKEFGSEPAGCSGMGSVAVSADGAALFWAAKDARASYSVDQGATWTACKGLPEPVKVPDWAPWFLKLAADRVNPRKIYAFDALNGAAYASVDGGASFKLTSPGLPSLPDYNLTSASIQTVPEREGDLWITSGKELVHSTNSGQDFTLVSSVDESYALGFGRAAPGRSYPALYASAKVNGVTGFFRSDDAGSSFVRINDDAHQYGGANVITGDPRIYGRVYVAPGGRGILYGEPN